MGLHLYVRGLAARTRGGQHTVGLYNGRAKRGEQVRALRSAGNECVFTFYLLDPLNSFGHVTCRERA